MTSLLMYRFVITNHFKKSLKRLVKKNKGVKEGLKKTLASFKRDEAISVGKGVFKLRMAGASKGVFKLRMAGASKGKSGGYRLYVFVMEIEAILIPLHIYEKSEKENIRAKELISHLNAVKDELKELL